MASLGCNADFLTVSLKNKSIAYKFDSGVIHQLEFDQTQNVKLTSKSKINREQNSHAYESVFLPCYSISTCGKWFVSSVDKCLLLWETLNWKLVSHCILQRSPIKLTFSSDGTKIIVADKGGDVNTYSRSSLTQEGSFLLGHLSLLFDVLITEDGKFIITCDRDEKIRASCYPNSFNIKSYCLGHEEFVTCLKLVPHCKDILISASGDGSLRLWNFKEGKELVKYLCLDDIDQSNFVVHDVNDDDEHIAITKFETFTINRNESGLCVLFDQYKGCIIYNIIGAVQDLKCNKLQHFKHEDVVLDLCISNDILWLSYCKEKYKVFALEWNTSKLNFEPNKNNNKVNDALVNINECLKNIETNVLSSYTVLYKRQFDNVQEYYKRKNDILCKSSKKNKMNM